MTIVLQVVHRRGTQHNNADALSRQPCKQCGRDSHVVGAVMQWPFQTYTPEDIETLQNDDHAVLHASNWKWQLPARRFCEVMESGGAVLTAAVQNAPGVRWGSVEMISKSWFSSPSASTAFSAAGQRAREITVGRLPWSRSKTDASRAGTVLLAWLLRERETVTGRSRLPVDLMYGTSSPVSQGQFRVEDILGEYDYKIRNPKVVIGSGMKLLDSSGDVTDDETENPHEELLALEDEPESETVQPTVGREEAQLSTHNKKSSRSLWDTG
eukprot:Em0003g399a